MGRKKEYSEILPNDTVSDFLSSGAISNKENIIPIKFNFSLGFCIIIKMACD